MPFKKLINCIRNPHGLYEDRLRKHNIKNGFDGKRKGSESINEDIESWLSGMKGTSWMKRARYEQIDQQRHEATSELDNRGDQSDSDTSDINGIITSSSSLKLYVQLLCCQIYFIQFEF
jgi:hypothetical protein